MHSFVHKDILKHEKDSIVINMCNDDTISNFAGYACS